MPTLMIQHTSGTNTFHVLRLPDGKRTTKPAEIIPPDQFPVEGRPNSNLSRELRWYIEKFLDYPFHPDTDVAQRVQDSLKNWGRLAFDALFDNRQGGGMLGDAIRTGYKDLNLQISADEPQVLSWPWEALRDDRANCLAHTCRIEHRINRQIDPLPLSEKLPRDRVNILLVTARPYANDVRYRSVSRLLVELIDSHNIPAHVHVLRPPTFDQLRYHLEDHPHFYHILHFDGHGAYGQVSESGQPGFTFKGHEGCLVFETDQGQEDPIRAEQLSALLREHALPVVVLMEQRIQSLVQVLRDNPYLIVWDNFEVVRGIPGTEVTAYLSEEDQRRLADLLSKLRGGTTKVILTSRSEEDWLGNARRKVGISGLDGEERWLFLEEILSDMGIGINREDPALIELMDLLGGHPLCMRVIVPALEKQSAEAVIQSVRSGIDVFEQEGGQDNVRFYATLAHARDGLPDALKPLLTPLGLHERYVDLDYLHGMAGQAPGAWAMEVLQDFALALVHMGLLFDHGNNIYGLHPALTGYLRTAVPPQEDRDIWTRAFVDEMGTLADSLAPRELHEQRGPFHIFGASFHHALIEAERLGMDTDFAALLQALAAFAQNTRNFEAASSKFEQLADFMKRPEILKAKPAPITNLG